MIDEPLVEQSLQVAYFLLAHYLKHGKKLVLSRAEVAALEELLSFYPSLDGVVAPGAPTKSEIA